MARVDLTSVDGEVHAERTTSTAEELFRSLDVRAKATVEADHQESRGVGVGLGLGVGVGVGFGVALGCFRIITGLPLQYFIAAGYLVVIVQTTMAPKMIVPGTLSCRSGKTLSTGGTDWI